MRRITPFDSLFNALHDFDGLVRFVPAGRSRQAPSQFQPAMECLTRGNDLVLRAELPGVDPAKVEVTVVEGDLVLRGEKPGPVAEEESTMLIHRGRFERRFTLPENVDAERMKASFLNGVLEVTIPSVAREPVRTIPIEVRSEAHGQEKAA